MSSTTKPTILFLGATGGCTLSTLIHTLQAGYPCIALARTPSKLTALLTAAGIPSSTLTTHLTIHPGNALSVADLKHALLIRDDNAPRLPATIISGLGGAPKLQFNLAAPFQIFTLDNPIVCQTAAAALVTALQEIYAEHPSLRSARPLLSFIATTGISRGPPDVPFLMRFLYHHVLRVPHVDKKAMEDVFRGEGGEVFRGVVGVRPTLLTDGAERGLEKIRVGREEAPALGYTVSRRDVGLWIYRSVVEGEGRGWEGEMVSLTS